jgi:uncharacterized phage protein (TIGR01671 family)
MIYPHDDDWGIEIFLDGSFSVTYKNQCLKSRDSKLIQCIGKKDKNGKEIYEGDYVKFILQKLFTKEEIIILIEGDQEHTGYYPFNEKFEHWSNESDQILWDTLEVIGNKFENPELELPKATQGSI